MDRILSKDMQATYRLQLGPDLTFDRVCELLPYFRCLGISHLYLSPCLKAAAGSTHGYDVVDPSEVNPQLGGLDGFDRLCAVSAEIGIGLILDIVPNHMAVTGKQNPWWWDVLSQGIHSRYAGFFDIRWHHSDASKNGKVLLPVLGEELVGCLKSRQIQIRRTDSEMYLSYFEHQFPISKRSITMLQDNHYEDSLSDSSIEAVNADPVRMKAFLDLQHYRLAFWRRANPDLNYRRFFDIHQLAGICVEKEEVFGATHERVLHWINDGKIEGLRIDHPDGLRDPAGYLERLQAAAHGIWVVVEKILEPGETLVPEWPVSGTTGYDFMNLAGGLFVDPESERLLTDFYNEFTGQSTAYSAIVREKKHLVLAQLFGSELSHLQDIFENCCRGKAVSSTFSGEDVRCALTEVIAGFPVYRTYIRPDIGTVHDRDRTVVQDAIRDARDRQPGIPVAVWEEIRALLLLIRTGDTESEFVWRFQQLTGPVMAKGVEDTSFYCFNRLICLNEVGGNPGNFGIPPKAFHRFCKRIQSQWPQTMLATATHDTKRGEDTRLRIGLLSEIPLQWMDGVRRWSRMNDHFHTNGFPDPNTEYFLYQTLVGAWPIGCDRLVPSMIKAAKEARRFTSWLDPNPEFEKALTFFIECVMGHADFMTDFCRFLEPLAWSAMVTSLSQTLIKCTAPGVPDIYQGTELWDSSLADPDNRRPVDFNHRSRLLADLDTLSISDILNRQEEGLPKLFVLKQVLSVRRRYAGSFGPNGEYRPMTAEGERAKHLVAFIRGKQVMTLAPRLIMGLNGDWKNTVIRFPEGTWKNVFTGEPHSGGTKNLSRILAQFPVALLVGEGGDS